MNDLDEIRAAKNYIIAHKKQIVTVVTALLGIAAVILAIVWWVTSSNPKVIYQPAVACDLFTSAKAKELLGTGAMLSAITKPIQSKNTASSKCGYTDGNPDPNNMIVAARDGVVVAVSQNFGAIGLPVGA